MIPDSSFPNPPISYYGVFSTQLQSQPDKPDWTIVQFTFGCNWQACNTLPGIYTYQQAQDFIRQWQGANPAQLYKT